MQATLEPKAQRPPRPMIPVEQILAWLAANYPALYSVAEVERDWVWLPVDLRGDHNKSTREALSLFGFRYAKNGHTLPSGQVGTWGHAGQHPIPFRRRNRDGKKVDLDAEIEKLLKEAGL